MRLFVRFLKLFIPTDMNLLEGMLVMVAICGAIGVVIAASFGVHDWVVEAYGYEPINPVWNLLGQGVVGTMGYVLYWWRTWGKVE
mgnify:FL=1|jgi:hypothetical protein